MQGPLRVGLLGLGIHGQRYARHLAQREACDLSLSAVWSRSLAKTQAVAASLGVAAEPSPEALLARADVDAVAIVVPVGCHAGLVRLAAGAGRAILLEKPMSASGPEADLIRDIARRERVPLTVGHTLRFDPLIARLRSAARSTGLGRLTGFAFEQRLEPRPVDWEDDPAVAQGGVLLQTGIHALDALRHVVGPERVVVLEAMRDRVAYRRLEDSAHVVLRLSGGLAGPEGAAGTVSTSKLGRARHHRFQLFFEEGGLEADFIDRRIWLTRGRDRTSEEVPAASTIVPLLEGFAGFVRGAGPNPVPPEEAAAAVRDVEAAYARMQARTDHGWLRSPEPVSSTADGARRFSSAPHETRDHR